ncbi:hypothetical protein [Diplocloster agilis]|uniref:Uncharacterized protein n=1 Tax=Diplocloster agilis TaxID=2850323 RepID=A0A949JZY6_9FIRM|nr:MULTISPECIES: hypothetical protein [Lachnospiraceae]MBU9737669.1 hypothetical protein [Diplocloster agilis]MCU6735270.1 hypothetical protein [Suonthocola fibrivorans]SCJ69359.1 Uncharacterised protein [uncultured Clostridium sp.]
MRSSRKEVRGRTIPPAKGRVNKRFLIAAAGLAVMILGLCLIFLLSKASGIRSDSSGVVFITEGGTVKEVTIDGHFPFRNVIPTLEESTVRGIDGTVIEEIKTYTLEDEFSPTMQGTMKIYIETADDMTKTYVLKFADRDITITDGRVVEP